MPTYEAISSSEIFSGKKGGKWKVVISLKINEDTSIQCDIKTIFENFAGLNRESHELWRKKTYTSGV